MSKQPSEAGGVWVVIELKKTNIPKWSRAVFVADDGEVFMSASSFGKTEMSVFFLAASDVVPMMLDRRHFYVPVSWAERQFPDQAKDIRQIAESVRDYVAAEVGQEPC